MFPESALAAAPHAPGVYLMQDAGNTILYVGKAKDLFKRLSSYAHHAGSTYNKTTVLLEKVRHIETILTNTEKEALILEASLIKKHRPRYNIILRDDKSYPYIKVSVQEEWPRVFMTRRKIGDKARYFGPYSSVGSMWATLKLIATLFPLRNCKSSELKQRSRPCLNNQIGKCLAPCAGQANRDLYMEHVSKILMLLEGRNRDLIGSLEQQMMEAAENLDFEGAAIKRDQIAAVAKTLEKQVIAAEHEKDQDVFGFARKDAAVTISILLIRNGLISGNRTFFFGDPLGEDDTILTQAIVQFYQGDTIIPREILLPFEPADFDILEEHFGDLSESRTKLKIPKRGDAQKLVLLANANALQAFLDQGKKEKSWENLRDNLQKVLHLEKSPERIECLDISNISGKQAIGSLVCFQNGEPDKTNFRHYKIKTVDGPNDYAMMKEVLERRLKRGVEENTLPHLFLVDGGKGQLGMALSVATELGLGDAVEWLGIAKEREDEGEKLYRPGRKNPIILPRHNPVLLFLMRIRDESHRYGVTFHRKLRNKATLASEIDAIPGIGEVKKRALLRHLGSLKRLRSASIEELTEVAGIGPELAATIFSHFQTVQK